MAAILRIAEAVRNHMLESLLADIDEGGSIGPATLEIYSGAMPASPETAPGVGNTLLSTLTFSQPSGAVAGGVLTFSAITEDAAADATDTAAWGRIKDGEGDAVLDANVGVTVGLFVITLNTTAIVSGGPVRITSGTISIPASISF